MRRGGERQRVEPESTGVRGPRVGTVHDCKTDAWSEGKKIYLPVLFVTCSASQGSGRSTSLNKGRVEV
jgi:hypothetical protein